MWCWALLPCLYHFAIDGAGAALSTSNRFAVFLSLTSAIAGGADCSAERRDVDGGWRLTPLSVQRPARLAVSLMSSLFRGPDADSLYLPWRLFWHRPVLAAVMTVMMLSLAGIPMTLGFVGTLRAGGRRSGQPVAGRRRGSGFRDYGNYYLRVVKISTCTRRSTGTRRADKLAVQRGWDRGADPPRCWCAGTGRSGRSR